MRSSVAALVALGLVALASPFVAGADTPGAAAAPHVMKTPDEVKWEGAPDSLPTGAKLAVLEGDPTKEGPFTMRLQLPANYRVAPHWHPLDEHVTVLSGTFYMGSGDAYDEKMARALPAGSFVVMPKEQRHFAFTRGETVIQLHGIGPWGITYVNPADDPRTKEVGAR